MNNFISSLYVWIDFVKAIGPIIIGIFGVWIAYGQFKLSKSQSKISQEQLLLAKQQADIALKKVELDIRDRRYEVFKRWNEAYFTFKDLVYNNIPKDQFVEARNTFFMVSDEIFYIFINNVVADMVPAIKQEIRNIENHRQEWLIEANRYLPEEIGWWWGDPFPEQVEPGFNGWVWCDLMDTYDNNIRNTLNEICKRREELIVQALQEMKIL
ncbi:hypothetical protein [Commensalibacter papalotli (ex Servin-Garciduenas et al. 2014)]|uniref:Uncharacterized protein n=1 Tax=Commensalibacter papalotli (ex Servin-Garciduenas et al. 2014) TaxID=1208583 RepID=W7DXW0_9PROT|nr:hypothetical protein [Commensalibacter papalotli (ex Servin-Garciduenas et al. 2014)]EUK17444.1 hypothetical protein COMX_10155 [Commensalibacter papalotli (ex Servin-Garciduenas et al. 2014)]